MRRQWRSLDSRSWRVCNVFLWCFLIAAYNLGWLAKVLAPQYVIAWSEEQAHTFYGNVYFLFLYFFTSLDLTVFITLLDSVQEGLVQLEVSVSSVAGQVTLFEVLASGSWPCIRVLIECSKDPSPALPLFPHRENSICNDFSHPTPPWWMDGHLSSSIFHASFHSIDHDVTVRSIPL